MAFCSNCGAQVSGAFCPNCGTAMGASPAGGSPNPGAYAPQTPLANAATGLEPHIAAALCYTPFLIGLIPSVIFILVAPYNQNKFIRFSAFQSLFLHLGIFISGIVLSIVFGIIAAIIHPFSLLLIPLWPILWLGILILFLFLMYKSFNNQRVKLPIVGDIAEKQS